MFHSEEPFGTLLKDNRFFSVNPLKDYYLQYDKTF